MNLDVPSVVFVLVVVTMLLGILLAIASAHAGNIRGIKHWSAANLYIAFGFSLIFSKYVPNSWPLVIGGTALAYGQAIQYSGIQLFKHGRSQRWIPVLVAGIVFLHSYWFVFVAPSVQYRAMANSIVLMLINASCARQLLIRIEQPLRTAYWLSGFAFAVMALLMLTRCVALYTLYPANYSLIAQVPLNYYIFFTASIAQLCISFGFVLMINYTLASQLERIAQVDSLTNALNRRALETIGHALYSQFGRNATVFSVLMIDIDFFKHINDSFGHAKGDEVLRYFASLVRQQIRSGDYFARYGGEEFCLLLPATSAQEASHIAERLRQSYADTAVLHHDNTAIYSTLSIGIAQANSALTDFQQLLAQADQALYSAKTQGRNRVIQSPG